MRVQLIKFLVGIVFVLPGMNLFPQDAKIVQHFDYLHQGAPIDLKIIGRQKRGGV